MDAIADIFDYFASSPLELVGLLSGLICVWLLVKQHIWAWPIGLVYSVVSVFVFFSDRLYASAFESVYYLGMNAYGWYFWIQGTGVRQDDGDLIVTATPRDTWLPLVVIAVVGSILIGWLLDENTDAALAYWDSASMVMAFLAMWMTARKYLENWVIWLVVDIVKTGVYVYQGIEAYAVLYGVYIGMAIWGWWTWRQSMRTQPA